MTRPIKAQTSHVEEPPLPEESAADVGAAVAPFADCLEGGSWLGVVGSCDAVGRPVRESRDAEGWGSDGPEALADRVGVAVMLGSGPPPLPEQAAKRTTSTSPSRPSATWVPTDRRERSRTGRGFVMTDSVLPQVVTQTGLGRPPRRRRLSRQVALEVLQREDDRKHRDGCQEQQHDHAPTLGRPPSR